MCFSLEADLIAGVAITAVGVDAMAHAHRPAAKAVAAIPLFLGAHQLVEAAVWKGLDDGRSGPLDSAAVWLYLLVAFALLPWFVPAVIAAIEPGPRRRLMHGCVVAGVVVAGVLVTAMARGPVEAHIDDHRIAYDVPVPYGGAIVAVYIAAVGVALAASSHRELRWFGIANLLIAPLTAWVETRGFISLWCFWAALTSVAIAVHLRRVAGKDAGGSAGDHSIGSSPSTVVRNISRGESAS